MWLPEFIHSRGAIWHAYPCVCYSYIELLFKTIVFINFIWPFFNIWLFWHGWVYDTSIHILLYSCWNRSCFWCKQSNWVGPFEFKGLSAQRVSGSLTSQINLLVSFNYSLCFFQTASLLQLDVIIILQILCSVVSCGTEIISVRLIF